MPAFDLAKQEAHIEVRVLPLVNWVWIGVGIMALGTFIALLPETIFTFAPATVQANDEPAAARARRSAGAGA
jgi:cytochrome c biogenesis factor